MAALLYIGSILSCIIFYVNLVSTLKNIKEGNETAVNTIIGSVCLVIIFLGIINLR